MKECLTSLHTHTAFCDGKDDVETMCRAAFEKGLSAIGFSAHAPIDKTGIDSTWHMKSERLESYLEAINSARRRWEGRIAVYAGLEADYIKGLRSAADNDLQNLGLDYIIGSVHYLAPGCGTRSEGSVPFTVDGPAAEVEKGVMECFSGDGEAMMHAYWGAVAEMIDLGGFDIIGHLDLIKKSRSWFNIGSGIYLKHAEKIAAAIAASGLVVEVNTGGLNRGYFPETCPSVEILRLLRQRNVPVMISADAHCAADLDGNYDAARRALRDAGYASHVIFGGRINGKPAWRDIEV